MSNISGIHLKINTTLRKLYHYSGTQLVNTYPVAVGKPSTPTPNGNYKIINKIVNPGGALGTRWMRLSIPDGVYGIHGTNTPSSIGNAVSHGCIRMFNHDVETLFPQVTIGTPVYITRKSTDTSYDTKTPPAHEKTQGKHVYTITKGDTIWKIAKKFNLNPEKILQYNQLPNPDLIYPGKKIIIPESCKQS
ncbi:MAG: L,D-transpeptidase family protein [Clostridiales bacterium]|nr:L,D-transpeptidase family protein [Clostridiales bacterium]MCF8021560.1 L,D-transpeptidase family protein [Clostridiales bacterium]